MNGMGDNLQRYKTGVTDWWQDGVGLRVIAVVAAIYLLVVLVFAIIWSSEPDVFDVQAHAEAMSVENNRPMVAGAVLTSTLVTVAETLLEKPGGYLSLSLIHI